MPTKKQRIMTSIDDETLKKIETVMKENGILEKSTFLTNAINYYLASLTTDDISKTLITKDTTNEVRRSLNPVKKEMSEQNRITQIMLDVIIRILANSNSGISKNDFINFVKYAVRDTDNEDGMNVLKITNLMNDVLSNSKNQNSQEMNFVEMQKTESKKIIEQPKEEKTESKKLEIDDKQEIEITKPKEIKKDIAEKNVSVNNDKTTSAQSPFGAWGSDVDLFSDF